MTNLGRAIARVKSSGFSIRKKPRSVMTSLIDAERVRLHDRLAVSLALGLIDARRFMHGPKNDTVASGKVERV